MRITKQRATETSRAFTLIELLVVISIIALLVGILLPALGAARKSARNAVCLSNIRQITIGLLTYAQSNRELLPPAMSEKRPALGNKSVPYQVGVWSYVTDDALRTEDLDPPYEYLAGTVFECPSAEDGRSGYSNLNHLKNGYGLNVMPLGTNPNSLDASLNFRQEESKRADLIETLSTTMLLTDNASFYVEWFHRSNAPTDLANGDKEMILAMQRHGPQNWNIAHFDGSASATDFYDVPGPTNSSLYAAAASSGGLYTPGLMLDQNEADVSRDFKLFWIGRTSR